MDQLATHATCLLAKEKGYQIDAHEECYEYFSDGTLTTFDNPISHFFEAVQKNKKIAVPALTQTSLIKWLREANGIFVGIDIYNYEFPGNLYFIPKIDFQRGHERCNSSFSKDFKQSQEDKTWKGEGYWTYQKDNYEMALEEGLLAALNLIE